MTRYADYSLGGAPLRVSIFKTRVEIENPGMLPLGLTIEDITDLGHFYFALTSKSSIMYLMLNY